MISSDLGSLLTSCPHPVPLSGTELPESGLCAFTIVLLSARPACLATRRPHSRQMPPWAPPPRPAVCAGHVDCGVCSLLTAVGRSAPGAHESAPSSITYSFLQTIRTCVAVSTLTLCRLLRGAARGSPASRNELAISFPAPVAPPLRESRPALGFKALASARCPLQPLSSGFPSSARGLQLGPVP